MIEWRKGDLFRSGAEALVNPVNCVGVMGKGLALAFKQADLANFAAYAAACRRGEVRPGRMFVWRSDDPASVARVIVNFPTKRHWRDKSRLEDIEAGLKDLERVVKEEDIRSLAIPPLGCGLGGLSWAVVRPMVEAAADRMPDGVKVLVYGPEPRMEKTRAMIR